MAPLMVGRGKNFRMFATAEGTAGSTFTRPAVEMAFRPMPVVGSPVFGSKIIPAWAGTLVPSVVVTGTGLAHGVGEEVLSAQMKSSSRPDRSPARSAAVGTVVNVEALRRRLRPW